MADTLTASKAGLDTVYRAIRQKGWTKTQTSLWWHDAQTSQATLRRFWRRIPIDRHAFQKICQVAGVGWESVTEIESSSSSPEENKNKDLLRDLSLIDCMVILLLLRT
ncbi:hypothetical protein PN466_03805 [Roseofilum reptotaenium CS-1145]|uniref:Uncharacterized protein n=1 Tax=Roseofilum reptotaenium AO1-A TaxID=1925591 RepID=A0A1L9QQY4_9CYAN|nr:hypothetical protein [Roseofilum reptotaenium]MDB9516086.1 hypothetical protein [Roseofilum reptotaenium CS-1145]OJJ25036.1 hypothetical protein BI308_13420 [Roseofilum reptotaenium AO1-A]